MTETVVLSRVIENVKKEGSEMGLATFKGGIHPYEGKELSENQPIEVLMPKGELVYPVSQHIGARQSLW